MSIQPLTLHDLDGERCGVVLIDTRDDQPLPLGIRAFPGVEDASEFLRWAGVPRYSLDPCPIQLGALVRRWHIEREWPYCAECYTTHGGRAKPGHTHCESCECDAIHAAGLPAS